MKFCAVVTWPAQFDSQLGFAHSVITSLNPASLPPIVIVTMFVVLMTALIWLSSTSAVLAPEQATKFSVVFGRCCLIRYG